MKTQGMMMFVATKDPIEAILCHPETSNYELEKTLVDVQDVGEKHLVAPKGEPPEILSDVVTIPKTTLEIQDCKVGAIQIKKGRSKSKKRKRSIADNRTQVEFKPGDQVILYHHKSNMYPGSKSTRWSGPYLLNRVLRDDNAELWHKNSGYFKVRKTRLKPYKESDLIEMGTTDPLDPKT